MQFPSNANLPFFAYGAFRQGELAFLRIRSFVAQVNKSASVYGEMRVRDGLLLLSQHQSKTANGHLFHFRPSHCGSAYAAIADLEPERQYEWSTQQVTCSGGPFEANVLIGKDFTNGSSIPDRDITNNDDPFFREALDIVHTFITRFSSKEALGGNSADLTNLLHLQMAYMLLWSSIERYVTLRYSLGDQVTSKVLSMATEPAFQSALQKHVTRTASLFAANEPTDKRKKVLNSQSPKRSLEYYYQVRCNITHRGKGAHDDFDRLLSSLVELSSIYRECLDAAFKEAAAPLPAQ